MHVHVLVLGVLGIGNARAETDLRVVRDPHRVVPRSLAMRAQAGSESPAPAAVGPRAPAPPVADRYAPLPKDLGDLENRVIFRFQVGYGIDQGAAGVDGNFPYDRTRETRLYTLGDAVLGTNGILQPSLSSYFAARFQFDQEGRPTDEMGDPGAAAVPDVYDATERGGALLIRSAYAQLDDMGPIWLRPLFVRAGRQFRYGPAIAHFDGLSASYDTRALDMAVFFGRRVALYGPGSDPFAVGEADPGQIGGATLRLRLEPLARVPLAVGGDFFSWDGLNHFEGSVRVDPRAGVGITASARTLGSRFAHWRVQLRARLSSTATVLAEVDDRRDDWMYDYVLWRTDDDSDARRWLQLGPAVSRLRASVRGGTVLIGNLDILFQAAVAYEHDDETVSSFSPSYVELGGAVEARLRHSVNAGIEVRTRGYLRDDPDPTDPLVDTAAWGERSYREGEVKVRYSLGERRFAAELRAFGRSYVNDDDPLPDTIDDSRTGGRFRVDGWIGKRLRFLSEYEFSAVSSRAAPELESLQSIRLMVEGSF